MCFALNECWWAAQAHLRSGNRAAKSSDASSVGLKSPIENFFFANLSQVYPQDRGLSVGVKLGRYAAEAVEQNAETPMDFAPY